MEVAFEQYLTQVVGDKNARHRHINQMTGALEGR